MQPFRPWATVLQENPMQRLDLDSLACVHPACHRFRPGEDRRTVRKVSGPDHSRLLRCHTCIEECSKRRGNAFFTTKLPETTAEEVMRHLDPGWSVRATARLMQVAKETVARLVRVAGRHAMCRTRRPGRMGVFANPRGVEGCGRSMHKGRESLARRGQGTLSPLIPPYAP